MAAEARNGEIEALAPAKINLFLHVLGRRKDGYHALESLVSFAEIGDRLSLVPGAPLGLDLCGPFAAPLRGEADNLVLRAARAFAAHISGARLGAFRLEKTLPVASGIGGGSSDCAAALRLLARANGLPADDPRLMDAARALGADVPVCLDPAAPRLMRGIGHELGPALAAAPVPALLVNPGVAVATPAVFAALGLACGARFVPEGAVPGPAGALLAGTRNDLEPPALRLAPEIGLALAALRAAPGCRLARMSGSGATCFGLFGSGEATASAAARIARDHPRWWLAPTRIMIPSPQGGLNGLG
ncbi:4-(cytidine 5'-diphospho)-2-C-methyl-D-erythritol kinase [Rhabdaerophilum calidifontis]|uniref:4-(cytidine 5'-diphospho)-2-C-methyl-D-erythritol kinase n=1 Tax=Rhabdaerophilum calidifontis TaxID=2604328 RepID=UPI001239B2FF|nr:4-(cytidine 5'-diphospho)-2-C-methyl-D-erythritol kinase [Rhabdaerophilum calidifontis]